jgi:hypothetical protein
MAVQQQQRRAFAADARVDAHAGVGLDVVGLEAREQV